MPTPRVATAAQIRELFQRIAPYYDDLNQSLSFGLHQIWKTMTVLWAAPPLGGHVLDLCCGSGDVALIAARYVGRQGRVTGVDFCPSLLQIARHRGERFAPGGSLQWVEADVLDLPLPAQAFDAVTMGYGLRNVVDIRQCLREIARVLRPGGNVAILDFHKPTDPQMAAWQAWYVQHWVVPAAAHYELGSDYDYILPSLEAFPSGEQQKQLALDVGLRDPQFYVLMGGMMGVLVAKG